VPKLTTQPTDDEVTQALSQQGLLGHPSPFDDEKTRILQAGMRAAELRQVDARQAEIRQAEFRQAELRRAETRQAEIRQAELREAEIVDSGRRDSFEEITGKLRTPVPPADDDENETTSSEGPELLRSIRVAILRADGGGVRAIPIAPGSAVPKGMVSAILVPLSTKDAEELLKLFPTSGSK
jgi:hypothetical protein